MFTELHSLAQKSTLMITIAAEGDNLRVSVTPAASDTKAKQSLRPLSLLGSADELDRDFAEALALWQAPRKSILEQATDAGSQDDDDDAEESAKPAAQKAVAPKTAAKAGAKKPREKKAPTKAAEKASAAQSDAGTVDPAGDWKIPPADHAPADTGADTGEANPTSSTPADGVIGTAAPDAPAAESAPTPDAAPAPTAPLPPPQPDPLAAAAEPEKDSFTLELF